MTQSDPWPRNRRTDAFERRISAQLEGAGVAGERVVVACSGGPDSVATLVAVGRALAAKRVAVAHFDHGLRPEAETAVDAAFVERVARDLGGQFVIGRPPSTLTGDEASAREARYRWLAGVLHEIGATTAVTGHTRDDQAETVLLNLARGGGLRGARAMAAQSAWPLPAVDSAHLRLLRPLLEVSRDQVEDYLDALGIVPRLDPTNELATYARNRVRREVLPALETVNPGARAQLAAFATRAREADEALDVWAQREFAAHGVAEAGCGRVARRALGSLPPEVAKRVLVQLGRCLDLELNAVQRAGLVAIASRRGARLDLAGGQAWTDAEWLHMKLVETGRR